MDFHEDENNLYDWSMDVTHIVDEVDNRPFQNYVSWKVPFPFDRLEDKTENRAARSFCMERLVVKMLGVWRELKESRYPVPFCVAYCLVTEPNMFASEVGCAFSRDKWERLRFRDVNIPSFKEESREMKIYGCPPNGIQVPDFVRYSYFKHIINDENEGIVFEGGFHLFWVENEMSA